MDSIEDLPPIDERLALPEGGYEILDGVVTFVVPADPPHAERHQAISVLIGTHVHRDFRVAIDMLTRTSRVDDIAPDVSVFPVGPDPVTGGRQVEQLAFEIVSTESMSHATKKAAKLAGRGVRRVFAVDLTRARLIEWSRELETWQVLEVRGHLEDPALAVPLSIAALLETVSTDDEVARALIAKTNAVFEAATARSRAEGHAEGISEGRAEGISEGRAGTILEVLLARGLTVSDQQRQAIATERDPERLATWVRNVSSCTTVDELIGTD